MNCISIIYLLLFLFATSYNLSFTIHYQPFNTLLPWASIRFEKDDKISIVFEDLSRNSVFFRTEVKPYFYPKRSVPLKYVPISSSHHHHLILTSPSSHPCITIISSLHHHHLILHLILTSPSSHPHITIISSSHHHHLILTSPSSHPHKATSPLYNVTYLYNTSLLTVELTQLRVSQSSNSPSYWVYGGEVMSLWLIQEPIVNAIH